MQRSHFAAAAENGLRAATRRVVQALLDFSSTVAALLEVDYQQVLEDLLLQEVRDSPQQHRPRANLRVHLQRRTPRRISQGGAGRRGGGAPGGGSSVR